MTNRESLNTLKENICQQCAYGASCMDSCDISYCDNREAIKTLEHEPCEDAISRQAVLDYIKGSEAELGHSTENDLVCEDIMNLPPVEPKREHGKWELISEDEFITEYRCSRCYEQSLISVNKILYKRPTHNFCPNYGTDMRGES